MEKNNPVRGTFVALLLIFVGLSTHVLGQGLKTPTISLEGSEREAYIGQLSFQSPAITITVDGDATLAYRFKKTFSIEGGTDGVDKDGKAISKDEATGTYVMKRYGNVVIGDKAGTVKVNIAIAPTDAYDKLYGTASTSYTIKIPKVSPTIKSKTADHVVLYYWEQNGQPTGQPMQVPEFTLSYVANNVTVDVSQYFDVTAALTGEATGDFTLSSDNYKLTPNVPASENGEYTTEITYTFTPKKGFEDTYKTMTKSITVTAKKLANGEKIPTKAYFKPGKKPKTIEVKDENGNIEQKTYQQFTYAGKWGGEAFVPLECVVEDMYGNDITSIMGTPDITVADRTGLAEGETYTKTSVYGPYNGMGGTKGVDVITYKFPQYYNEHYADCEASYELLILPRVPKVQITPDPATLELTAGTKIDYNNRFEVIGVFYDELKEETVYIPYGNSGDYGGMSYAFEFKYDDKDKIIVENFPHMDTHYEEITDQNDGTWCKYITVNDYGTDKNWTLTFAEAGSYSLRYEIFPYNSDYWDTGSEVLSVTYMVSEKIQGKLIVDPEEVVTYNNDTQDFNEPEAKVVDVFGEDITENYNLTYEIISDEGGTGTKIDPNTGEVTIGNTGSGDVTIKITATPKEEDGKYTGCEGTYIIHVKDNSGLSGKWYEIIKRDTPDDQYMGKLHFIGKGTLAAGYTIKKGIPGLDITFGKYGGYEIELLEDASEGSSTEEYGSEDVIGKNKHFMQGATVETDGEGFPTNGLFYELNPYTNGFLTVDAKWEVGHEYVLIARNGNDIWKETFVPQASESKGDHKFRFALMAGTTYYLYDNGSDTDESSLHVHGVSFEPAFLFNRVDDTGYTTATKFMNGYSGSVPKLLYKPADNVNFTSADENYAVIDSKTGIITTNKKTPSNDRVKITGTVTSAYADGIYKAPSYDLFIGDIPSFWVEDGMSYGIGQRVSTTNIATNISMIFGGWQQGEKRPYIKGGTTSDLMDEWNVAKMDSAGQNNRTIDGFKYATSGKQNPLDENGASFKFGTGNQQAFKVPCRGTYLKFEPEESGTLIVYLVQNGICQYNGDPSTKPETKTKIKWNPVFIMDESGKDVELLPEDNWTGIDLPTKGSNPSYYTEGIYRCAIDDPAVGGWDWESEFLKEGNGSEKDKTALMNAWAKGGKGGDETIYKTDKGGYVTVSKAYTRYALHVKSGKTYFISQNGSKLFLCGFSFVPDGYGDGYTAGTSVPQNKEDLNDTSQSKAALSQEEFVDVTLNRAFEADKWSALCLPFSVNETQFKSIFGDDAKIITFDFLLEDATAHYTQHVYHMIEAGRPYFVKPTKTINQGELKFERVSFEGVEAMAIEGIGPKSPYIYTFVGTYSPVKMPSYAYYMAADNTLHRQSNAAEIKGYRAYLKAPEGSNGRAEIKGFSINNGDEEEDGGGTTDITDVFGDDPSGNTTAHTGKVVNIQGQTVRQNADLKGLPKGIYIVNGKKYTVK